MAIAVVLLCAQAAGIARAPWSGSRYFAWAPHDKLTEYTIHAWHEGRPVSREQIAARYQLPAQEWHHWGNLVTVIRTMESRQVTARRWTVQVHYRINRHTARQWCYPEPCSRP